jgi:hypothetical protein
MKNAKYTTRKAIYGMVLHAGEGNGLVDLPALNELFKSMKVSSSAKGRALQILFLCFRLPNGTHYIPVRECGESLAYLCEKLYQLTKVSSGSMPMKLIKALFSSEMQQEDILEEHARLAALAADRVSYAELAEKKYEKTFNDWEDAIEERDRIKAVAIDLRNRLTRTEVLIASLQRSFGDIVKGMLPDDDGCSASAT